MSPMRVTVCQLPDPPGPFEDAWEALADHVAEHGSELVLLPEMPAPSWFCAPRERHPEVWQEALDEHARLIEQLPDLGAGIVVTSRPAEREDHRVNEAIAWREGGEVETLHEKRYLPDEPGWHEARWYEPGAGGFETTELGRITVGVQICTDVMFNEHARALGREGAHAILVPRASEGAPRWSVACRMAAVASGAYVLSSNRGGPAATIDGTDWGGEGMVVDPEGRVLARTTDETPFATVDIDLAAAEAAKETYPRYVAEPG